MRGSIREGVCGHSYLAETGEDRNFITSCRISTSAADPPPNSLGFLRTKSAPTGD
jgi:hypothetical protein